jgi:hypothetical protein
MTESGVRAVAASRRQRSALRSAYSALAARGRNLERAEDGAERSISLTHRMPSAASGLVLYDIDDESDRNPNERGHGWRRGRAGATASDPATAC